MVRQRWIDSLPEDEKREQGKERERRARELDFGAMRQRVCREADVSREYEKEVLREQGGTGVRICEEGRDPGEREIDEEAVDRPAPVVQSEDDGSDDREQGGDREPIALANRDANEQQ